MNEDSKIYIAGHAGLVGSALLRCLQSHGYTNILTRSIEQLDLRNQQLVNSFFQREQPEYVFIAAAKVGGIFANATCPADFLYDNIMIATNIIHAAFANNVKKLLFLGSSCIYPKQCPQPIREEYLLTGPLEITNEAYAIAKIAGIKLCQSYYKQYNARFIACMPTNLYGPGDNFDFDSSHVIPGIIAKMHHAKNKNSTHIDLWGSGQPRREFLFVDDLAQALLLIMHKYETNEPINIGTGSDITIAELALVIKNIVEYQGTICWNTNKPDGTMQKLLDVRRIGQLGWQAETNLKDGLQKTYDWYIQHYMRKNEKNNFNTTTCYLAG